MMRWAIATALGLSLLEVVLSSSAATGRVGSALSGVANATSYLLSPAKPLVPDRRTAAAASSSSSSSAGASTGTVPTSTSSLGTPV